MEFCEQDMAKVPMLYIFGALLPAVMIDGLYFFDHSVASQLAQQKEFNLKNPSVYHYDILLLGLMTLLCGLMGLPPSNGVLLQSSMHTKILAVLRKQIIRRKMVECAKKGIKRKANTSEIYGEMQAIFVEIDNSHVTNNVVKELEKLKTAVMKIEEEHESKCISMSKKLIDEHLSIHVNEQRLSNLL
ncbi:hypothetical protein SASPL_118787 [Salvia splendens]|uniref:Bicarbonate transporter-like transmembrane domain-containing protein n=1 Tax=Salvia splendens TaxID=180675 RepID=A0A8X8ZXK0_SALSN|nr:hypothetical protein SASPL_118787 [Salvia splendens]